MSRPTPREWHAVFQAFNPAETAEAIALLAESPGLQCILKAASNKERSEPRGGSTPTKLLARRGSRCPICGRGIMVGEPIYYARGRDAWHQRCEVRR